MIVPSSIYVYSAGRAIRSACGEEVIYLVHNALDNVCIISYGLDDRYCAPRSAQNMQSGNAAHTKMDEQVQTAPAVYDLVAAVYYHSSEGPLQAIDGKPLSGSEGSESAKQTLPREIRGKVVEGKPSAWCNRQAGHYTAAVFRSTRDARCRTHSDAEEFLSADRSRDNKQERSGSW